MINGDNVCLGVVVGHWSGQVPAFTTILENLFPSMSTNETKNQVQAQNTAASKGRTFACLLWMAFIKILYSSTSDRIEVM